MNLKSISNVLLLVFSVFLVACETDDDASTQVTNSTALFMGDTNGTNFIEVRVADVSFSQYLDDGDCLGCSTGFKSVPEGQNTISYQLTIGGDFTDIGTLGPFEKNKHYSVNMRDDGTICAELWHRTDTDSIFTEDFSRTRIDTNCDFTTTPSP